MTWIRNPTICYIFVHILDLFVDGLDTLEEGRQVALHIPSNQNLGGHIMLDKMSNRKDLSESLNKL